MAAALITGVLPDPLGTALPLLFVGLLILVLYLRFRSQSQAPTSLPSTPGKGPGPAVEKPEGPSSEPDGSANTLDAPSPGGDREV